MWLDRGSDVKSLVNNKEKAKSDGPTDIVDHRIAGRWVNNNIYGHDSLAVADGVEEFE